ncbi:MAG TPA: NADPH:quinone reductase [Chloroflexota bacterium]|jgi:NADPH2:quinone reductase
MLAIVVRQFGEPEVMRLEQVDEPTPGRGEVLVRARAIGVNPVETYVRSGNYASLPSLPYTPGADAAGEVAARGEGVDDLAVGQRVYVTAARPGAYTELLAAPRERVFGLPERLSFEQGAAVGVPYATAYRALYDKGQGRPGEWLLVHGASGAVGTALVQMGRQLGMRVIGTAGTEPGRELAARVGAEQVLDHHQADHMQRAFELTGGQGIDLIVELLANANLGRDLPALARHGRVVVVGSRGAVEITPRDLMSRDASVTGMTLFNATPDDLRRIHHGLAAGFRSGALSPVVDKRFPLAEAAAAHRAVMEAGHAGKVVLTP